MYILCKNDQHLKEILFYYKNTLCIAMCIFKFDWFVKFLLQTEQENFCRSWTTLSCNSYSCFDSNCLSHFLHAWTVSSLTFVTSVLYSVVVATEFCSALSVVCILSSDFCTSVFSLARFELCSIVFWCNSKFSLLSKNFLHCVHSYLIFLWKLLEYIKI